MTTELLIAGAGPAGVSAALWARTLGLSVTVIERAAQPGGQLHAIHFHPRELPGFAAGDGPALARVFASQLADEHVDVRYGVEAAALACPPGATSATVTAADGVRLEASALLVATGLRRRRLEVPGEREFEGRGVSTSATRDRARFAGGDVAVAGGGDAAYENALLLAAAGCRVWLIVRGATRARADFRARVAAEPRISVLEGSRVTAILGDTRVRALRIQGPQGTGDRPVAGLVVKVGSIPNTEWCGSLARDGEGHLRVDPHFRTSAPRVWAAGDVTRSALPSIAVAIGQAGLAVADIRAQLRGEPAGRASRGAADPWSTG